MNGIRDVESTAAYGYKLYTGLPAVLETEVRASEGSINENERLRMEYEGRGSCTADELSII